MNNFLTSNTKWWPCGHRNRDLSDQKFRKILLGFNHSNHVVKDDLVFGLLHQDFGIMPPLVPVFKILNEIWGHRKNLGESEGQTFKGSDREKCQF